MPCLIKLLTPGGFQPVDYTADSLADAALHEPQDGIYTVTNTAQTDKVLKLTAHLDRLEQSAARAGMPLILDRDRLRGGLRRMIADSGFGDVRFRITISRAQPDDYLLSVEPFHPVPAYVYERGIRLQTVDAQRGNPGAKTTGWMQTRKSLPPLREGMYEGLLVGSNGELLEGLSSNFYALLDGRLHTATEGVLPGIAQQVVLEIAPAVVPVSMEPVTLADVPSLAEAFITSSSRGIIPVIGIDDTTIGEGTPGPVTRQLREVYLAWVEAHLETL